MIAADSYLHLSTKSVFFTEVIPWNVSFTNYALLDTCVKGNNTYLGQLENPCLIFPSEITGETLLQGIETIPYMNNASTSGAVYTYAPSTATNTSDFNATIPDPLAYAYIGPPTSIRASISDVDYLSTTLALSTTCKIITSNCTVPLETSSSTTFDCAANYPAFSGSLSAGGNFIEFFNSPDATSNQTVNGSDPALLQQNTFTFGWASAAIRENTNSPYDNLNDPGDFLLLDAGYEVFILLCTSS